MKRYSTVLFAAILMVALTLSATEDTRWLNVHVIEGEGGANVKVHLPLPLILAVLNSVDVENFHGGKVDLEITEAVRHLTPSVVN